MKENHSSDSCTKVSMFNSMIAVFTVLVLCVYSLGAVFTVLVLCVYSMSVMCLQYDCHVFTLYNSAVRFQY